MLVGQQTVWSPDERYCRDLTRREAANFYWGFIALPRPQRIAIYALYSFARQVDDEADLVEALDGHANGNGTAIHRGMHPAEPSPPAPQVLVARKLQAHRRRVERCLAGTGDDPVMRVLANVVTQFAIPREDLEALIDGVEMDLRVRRYQTWDQLRAYCQLVASSVGRMCVRVFGFSDPAALEYADDLGVAMQLANILRDVREDMSMGRIYLPQEDLRRFHIDEQQLLDGRPGTGWDALMRHELERARQLFASGLRVTEVIPRRAAVCVLTMAGIYQAIVEQIEQDPAMPLSRRAHLSGGEKLSVMVRSWLQAV